MSFFIVSRRSCSLLFVLLLLLDVFGCDGVAMQMARADGGAPNLAYVSGTPKGISRIDIGQQQVTGTMDVAGDPHALLLSYDGRFLYVAQPTLGRVEILAARTSKVECQVELPGSPSLLALDPVNNLLYVAGNGSSIVTELSSLDCAQKKNFYAQGPVYGIALAQVGANNQLCVSVANALTFFDTITAQRIHTLALPAGPRLISLPPGATAYTETQQGSIVAVDLHSYKTETVISGGMYGPMDFDESTGELFVPDSKHHQLLELSPISVGLEHAPEPHRSLPFEASPLSVAITSDGQFGFVALSNGKVAMLDLPGHHLVKTIPVGGRPHFIITGLYAPVVGITAQETTLYGTFVRFLAYAFLVLLGIGPVLVCLYYLRKKRRRSSMHQGQKENEEQEQQQKKLVEK